MSEGINNSDMGAKNSSLAKVAEEQELNNSPPATMNQRASNTTHGLLEPVTTANVGENQPVMTTEVSPTEEEWRRCTEAQRDAGMAISESMSKRVDKTPLVASLDSQPSSSFDSIDADRRVLVERSQVKIRSDSITSMMAELEHFGERYDSLKKIFAIHLEDLESAGYTNYIETPETTSPRTSESESLQHIRDRHKVQGIDTSWDYAYGAGTRTTSDAAGSPVRRRRRIATKSADSPLPLITCLDARISPITRQLVFEREDIRGRDVLKIHCSQLIGILRVAAESYPGPQYDELSSPTAIISEPFPFLFHSRDIFKKSDNGGDGHGAVHARLLLDYVGQLRSWKKFEEIASGNNNKIRIAFKDLPFLYTRGKTVFAKVDDSWRAFKVEKVDFHPEIPSDIMYIHAYYLDFEKAGKRLVPQIEVLTVHAYPFEKPIVNLDVVPEGYTEGLNLFPESLIDRGQAFWQYHEKPCYREYSGTAWRASAHEDPLRVIVDYVTSSKLKRDIELCIPRTGCCCIDCHRCDLKLVPYCRDGQTDTTPCTAKPHTRDEDKSSEGADDRDLGNPLLFCPSKAWAFSLQHRSWKMVEITSLEHVKCDKTPFDQVWMSDPEHKKHIDALVAGHLFSKEKCAIPDLVRDKERGLNILLHGGPGTGKTLTAECLAAKYATPLFKVTCGELGVTPEALEQRLQESLLNAANWNAIVLLDEADVFLSQRELQNPSRNALVSILLHQLEVSKCVVILTTSRPVEMDEAVESRMQLTVGLSDFDLAGQLYVWLNLLDCIDLDNAHRTVLQTYLKQELKELQRVEPSYRMNGRQIRNCLRAALALAMKDGESLGKEHIKKVLYLGKLFRRYMTEMEQRTQANKVRSLGYRLPGFEA